MYANHILPLITVCIDHDSFLIHERDFKVVNFMPGVDLSLCNQDDIYVIDEEHRIDTDTVNTVLSTALSMRIKLVVLTQCFTSLRNRSEQVRRRQHDPILYTSKG